MGLIFGVVVILVLGTMALSFTMASLYRRVGPNRALIVYGKGNTQVIQGGGRIVYPMLQSARELSMELVSLDVAPQQNLYTNQGVAVIVEAVAQIKVKADPESIKTAAEQLLTKTPQESEGLIRLVMEGHLRGIVGQLTVEQMVKEPEMVSAKMRGTVADDLSRMGLEVVSFTIKEVRDENEYISNMGKPDIARIRREADIAAAEAERDTTIKRAQATREAAIAQAAADQERVVAQTASETKQAEAKRDLDLKRAEYESSVKTQQAATDKAYEISGNQAQQQVVAEQVRIEQVQRQEQIKVQELEILRREKELTATVQ
ncbi:MAG TPA: SPFH domain-containing protein, partial [Dehalococcoidia bacterium]|nr:SPFH domain-containing protein [Dehalococcoidia bacterium]